MNNSGEKKGEIISVDEDGGSEIAVEWDNGKIEHCLMCAKKGHFDLVYL